MVGRLVLVLRMSWYPGFFRMKEPGDGSNAKQDGLCAMALPAFISLAIPASLAKHPRGRGFWSCLRSGRVLASGDLGCFVGGLAGYFSLVPSVAAHLVPFFIFFCVPSWIPGPAFAAAMVATDPTVPLRGSSIGGSRAQKPRIVMQVREKLGANSKRRQRGLSVSSSSSTNNASGDDNDGVRQSSSPVASSKSAAPEQRRSSFPNNGKPSPVSITRKSPALEQRRSSFPNKGNDTGMLKRSVIHTSPRKPTLRIGTRHKNTKTTTTNASRPKYFEAGEYEYELSLNEAPSLGIEDGAESVGSMDEETTAANSNVNSQLHPSPPRPPSSCSLSRSKSVESISASLEGIVISSRPIPQQAVRKTIYLIRHAESDENRRQQSLYKSVAKVRKLILPTKAGLAASLELVDVNAQIDSDVSEVGKRQIDQVGSQLRAADFVVKEGIQLVVHSPLRRARQTSAGMLGCVAPKDDVRTIMRSSPLPKARQVSAGVLECVAPTIDSASRDGGMRRNGSIGAGLGSLLNPTPPDPTAGGMAAPSVSRIVELPELAERTPLEWLPVNHDAFTNRIASFEKWLAEQPETTIAVVGHSHYFQCMLGLNYKFRNCDVWRVTYDSSVGLWTSPEEIKQTVRKDYWKQKEDKRREKSERVLKDFETRKEKIKKDIEETKGRVKEDWERLLRQMKIDGYKEDEDDDDYGNQSSAKDVTQNALAGETTDNQATANNSDTGELEKEHLPRGWSDLRRLYTYNSKE